MELSCNINSNYIKMEDEKNNNNNLSNLPVNVDNLNTNIDENQLNLNHEMKNQNNPEKKLIQYNKSTKKKQYENQKPNTFLHIKLLLYKNYLIFKRQKLQGIFIFILPIFINLVVLYFITLIEQYGNSEFGNSSKNYDEKQIHQLDQQLPLCSNYHRFIKNKDCISLGISIIGDYINEDFLFDENGRNQYENYVQDFGQNQQLSEANLQMINYLKNQNNWVRFVVQELKRINNFDDSQIQIVSQTNKIQNIFGNTLFEQLPYYPVYTPPIILKKQIDQITTNFELIKKQSKKKDQNKNQFSENKTLKVFYNNQTLYKKIDEIENNQYNLYNTQNSHQINLHYKQYPNSPNRYPNEMIFIFENIEGIFATVLPLYLFFIFFKEITKEKTSKIRKGLNILGVSHFSYWNSWIIVAVIFSVFSALYIFVIGLLFQRKEGITWKQFKRSAKGRINRNKYIIPSGLNFMIYLVIDVFFYLLIMIYFDTIVDSNRGIGKPWYFIFTKLKFWQKNKNGQKEGLNQNLLEQNEKQLYIEQNQNSGFEKNNGNLIISHSFLKYQQFQQKRSNKFGEELHTSHIQEKEQIIQKFIQIQEKKLEIENLKGIYINNLSKKFKSGFLQKKLKTAINNLYLHINPNETLGLLGHNGAGKTTLINILTGIMKQDEGEIIINGKNPKQQIQQIRKKIGICPQFDILWNELTAKEHLQIFCQIKGITDNKQIKYTVKEKLKQVNLDKVQNAQTKTYSGGMKRRLSFIISTIGEPEIIFLDEPTTAMDPKSKRDVWEIINDLKKNRSIILTSHSMQEVDLLSDRIVILNKGEIKCIGTSLQIKNQFGDLIQDNFQRNKYNWIRFIIEEIRRENELDADQVQIMHQNDDIMIQTEYYDQSFQYYLTQNPGKVIQGLQFCNGEMLMLDLFDGEDPIYFSDCNNLFFKSTFNRVYPGDTEIDAENIKDGELKKYLLDGEIGPDGETIYYQKQYQYYFPNSQFYQIFTNYTLDYIQTSLHELPFFPKFDPALILKKQIDNALINYHKMLKSEAPLKIHNQYYQFPYIENSIVIPYNISEKLGPFLFFLLPLFIFMIFSKELLQEKISKIKQGLQIFGVNQKNYWLSWLITGIFFSVFVGIYTFIWGYLFYDDSIITCDKSSISNDLELKNTNILNLTQETEYQNFNQQKQSGIQIYNLSKTYTSGKFNKVQNKALNCLNLEIQQNEVVGLLGHNGAGKTTLINILTGILQKDEGKIYINGKDIEQDLNIIRQQIGVCPQFDILWQELTAKEHIQIFCQLRVGTYSGGMKRRLSFAISNIGNPSIILLDEPTTGLDPKTRRQIWDIIKKAKKNKSIILTTHSMEEADILSDTIVIISSGQIKAQGTSIHLKNQYGNGFRIDLLTLNQENVIELIHQYFPNMLLLDQSAGSLIYQIEKQFTKQLIEFLNLMEEIYINQNEDIQQQQTNQDQILQSQKMQDFQKLKNLIKDFSIQNSTLEEVFMIITKQQE
ncbi:P-loop containing nucleoside triphosphate hydrolase [Pseudocohnilembus persalinus]|uniref:p-loop containing nucleoside triphosphate hydrolase n=1 Tax=Pseudocohnilembus persalinus TaxID=266149 RepID=A0A0V0Q8S8_PSEPJ|nr:P-loop containing nucleoside triphosphate hydrolase [Pseudocohnilembus persalinus]|eukprot:KRW98659.1 P-loop containing nucleoside triphosphate hydrolase [Pseudocohnilembus persalinus]